MDALKFAPGTDDVIEGWAAPFGGPFSGKDLDGEAFTKSTDFCLDWFETRPMLYHHGRDEGTGTSVVGRVKAHEFRDKGLWAQAQLDKQHEYFGAIKELIDKGALFFSSGAMAHLVQKSSKSEITRWPWVELSFTSTPSNLLATLDYATAEKHFKSAGLDTDAFKAAMDAAERNSLDDADFAYIDADGGRHLPINDASHVRNALARFDETHFESDDAKEKAHAKIMAAAEKFGIDAEGDDSASGKSADPDSIKSMEGSYEDLIEDLSAVLNPMNPFGPAGYSCIVATFPDSVLVCRYGMDDDETYWTVAYTLDESGEPVLGKATQVEQTYVPKKSLDFSDIPLSLDAHMLSRHAGALMQRTEGLHERRIKEGRVLSTANRTRISEAIDGMESATKALQALLDASDRMNQDQAKAAALGSVESLLTELELLSLFEHTL